MSNPLRKFFLLIALIGSISPLISQSGGGTSPYSRLGLGDLVDQDFMFLRHMGGIRGGYADLHHINISNPASYSYLKATAFDVGLSTKYSRLKDDQNTQGIWSGNLDYIGLAFPLRNPINEVLDRVQKPYTLGMSFALVPFSQVGYNISSEETDPDLGVIERNFQGSGGTYKVIWGNSIKYNNISFGLNLGYIFGKINYERNVFFTEVENSYFNNFINDYSIGGFTWRLGTMYRLFLNEKDVNSRRGVEPKVLNIGLYGNSRSSFNTNSSVLFRNIYQLGIILNFQDTLAFEEELKGDGTLPGEIGFGLTYYDGNKLSLGMNFEQSFWSKYKNDANPEDLFNAYRISFGGYYRPNYKSFNKYFQRVYYRFGLYYGTDPRKDNDEQLNAMGFNFGMGLPFVYQRKISHINLGLELGLRGTNAPIRETFVKISAGFTFNDDEWFIKRKYN